MDMSTLRKLRRYVKAVANRVDGIHTRVTNEQLVQICQTVKRSDNGIDVFLFSMFVVVFA